MTLTELRELADEAIENEAECPDCCDNRWDLDDALSPEVVKALVAVAEAADWQMREAFDSLGITLPELARALDALEAALA